MSSNEPPCPIWDGVGPGLLPREPRYFNSPRAGGPFMLDRFGADFLKMTMPRLSPKQKANLSYWIYQHNHRYRLLGLFPARGEDLLVVDWEWLEGNRDREPFFSDRLLTYLRELIRSDEAGEQPDEDLLQAAGGCRGSSDLAELQRHTVDQGWTGSNKPGSEGTSPYQINASARIYVEEQLGEQDARKQVPEVDAPDEREFDVFISHTTEDKAAVARPLAEALNDAGLRVWYDEFELKIGDSLRRKIDKGLATSRCGVVVLSPAFFGRGWPEYELDGLTTQMVSRERVLLPVWHNITEHEVRKNSPSLVDRVARSTETHTVEAIAAEIVDVIRNTPES